jgi:hypothetical protein
MARPIPRAAPVTSATCPSRRTGGRCSPVSTTSPLLGWPITTCTIEPTWAVAILSVWSGIRLAAAADHARHALVFSYPSRNLLSRAFYGVFNLVMRLTRSGFGALPTRRARCLRCWRSTAFGGPSSTAAGSGRSPASSGSREGVAPLDRNLGRCGRPTSHSAGIAARISGHCPSATGRGREGDLRPDVG